MAGSTRSQLAQRAVEKAASAAKKAAGLQYLNGRIPSGDIEARLAEIPRFDLRDFTGRMFGDPLPERSALARKHLDRET
jgi:hypothetical protein